MLMGVNHVKIAIHVSLESVIEFHSAIENKFKKGIHELSKKEVKFMFCLNIFNMCGTDGSCEGVMSLGILGLGAGLDGDLVFSQSNLCGLYLTFS